MKEELFNKEEAIHLQFRIESDSWRDLEAALLIATNVYKGIEWYECNKNTIALHWYRSEGDKKLTKLPYKITRENAIYFIRHWLLSLSQREAAPYPDGNGIGFIVSSNNLMKGNNDYENGCAFSVQLTELYYGQ